MNLTKDQIDALHLTTSKYKDMTARAHTILNLHVKALLDLGLIDYCARNGRAYKLTVKGKKAIHL